MTCFSELRNNFGKSFNNSPDRNSFLRARDSVWLILKKIKFIHDRWQRHRCWQMSQLWLDEDAFIIRGSTKEEWIQKPKAISIPRIVWHRALPLDRDGSCSMIIKVVSLQRNLKRNSFTLHSNELTLKEFSKRKTSFFKCISYPEFNGNRNCRNFRMGWWVLNFRQLELRPWQIILKWTGKAVS